MPPRWATSADLRRRSRPVTQRRRTRKRNLAMLAGTPRAVRSRTQASPLAASAAVVVLFAAPCHSQTASVAEPAAHGQSTGRSEAAAGAPDSLSPPIPAIGVRNTRYLDVPASAQGPAIDPAKGYRLQDLGQGLYMITDNIYQSMFLVYGGGVVVVDAPPNYAARIPEAISRLPSRSRTSSTVTRTAITSVAPAPWAARRSSSPRRRPAGCCNARPTPTGRCPP